MFINFSFELQQVLKGANKEKMILKHSYVGTEHIFLSILSFDNEVSQILNSFGIDYKLFNEKVIEHLGLGKNESNLFIFTPLLKKCIENAIYTALDEKKNELNLIDLFYIMMSYGEGVSYRILNELNVDLDLISDQIKGLKNNYKSYHYLNEYGVDLCLLDYSNRVISRDKEIKEIINILLRKNKCNPLLIGDAGVGKTAIVEELAKRIKDKKVPAKLFNKRIFSISMANLVSGTKYRGEFEEKLLNIIKEIDNSKNVILFIDEIHTLVGAGGAEGAIDASNILKPSLARGDINVIGATTFEEYKKYIENDKALVRRFQNVIINEPSFKDTINILNGVKEKYELFHNVAIKNEVIDYISKISKKFPSNKKEPDRSLDLLDDVCSFTVSSYSSLEEENQILQEQLIEIKNKKELFLNNNNYNMAFKLRKKERIIESQINKNNFLLFSNKDKKIVDVNDVRKALQFKYGIQVNKYNVIKSDVLKRFTELKEHFTYNYILNDILNNVIPIFDDDNVLDRPISLLFSGNDYESKRSLIYELSNKVFNSSIININLANYDNEYENNNISLKDNKSKFESLKSNPQSIILFEHLEECSYKLFNKLKQILNRGFLEDKNGFRIYFNNSLIVFFDNSNNSCLGFNNMNNNMMLYKYISKTYKFEDKDRVLA